MDTETNPAPTKAPISRNFLTRYESHRLYGFIGELYAELRKDDAEFAVEATEVLGFPVTVANVMSHREELNIPSKAEQEEQENAQALRQVTLLQERVAVLEEMLAGKLSSHLFQALHQRMLALEALATKTAEAAHGH